MYFSILEVPIFSSCRKNLYRAFICRNHCAISKRKHGAAKFCLRKVLNRLPFFTRVITICYNPISLSLFCLFLSRILSFSRCVTMCFRRVVCVSQFTVTMYRNDFFILLIFFVFCLFFSFCFSRNNLRNIWYREQ